MNNTISKDEAFEVSDSTDWLETPLRSLAGVDAALRCQVCKDFYTTPMITSCSHTFCSLCIRRCLNNDGRCPACREPDQAIRLRSNGVMEDLVEAFKKARPEVFEFAKRPIPVMGNTSPKRDRQDAQLDRDYEEPPPKRTRSSGRNTRGSQAAQPIMVPDSDGEDGDFVLEECPKGFVQCPICDRPVKPEQINAHIDRNCQDEPAKPKNNRALQMQSPMKSSQQAPARPERLAQVHYPGLKDQALRKKLFDQGLSASGSRQQQEKRFTEWVTLWNANCDARIPKSKRELRTELDTWERTQGARAQATGPGQSSGAQIRDKDFDGAAWSSKHDLSFKELIANARKKQQPKPPSPESPSQPANTELSSNPASLPSLPNSLPNSITPTDLGKLTDLATERRSNGLEHKFYENQDILDAAFGNPVLHPRSQFPNNMQISDDSAMSSDISTMKTIQP